MQSVQTHLRTTFLSGTFAIIPIAVTIAVIVYVEQLTREPLKGIGLDIRGLGIVLALVLIYLTGLFVSSLVGRLFLRFADRVLSRLPLLRELYTAWKQVSLAPGGGEGIYAKVMLVPGPAGQYALAFSSGDPIAPGSDMVAAFLPNAPNPVMGRVMLVPLREMIVLAITAEEAFKLLLSSGNYIPAEVGERIVRARVGT